VERILLLRKAPIVGGLTGPQLSILAEATRERFFPKGTVLMREGEPVEAVYYLVEGRVRATFRGRSLGFAEPGAAIGALGVLVRDDHGLDVVAEADTLTLQQDSDAVFEILEDNFGILRYVLQTFCRQMIETVVHGPVAPISLPRAEIATTGAELDLVDRIFLLRKAPPFARSSLNALVELARSMFEVRFEPGVKLWNIGQPARNLLLVVSGSINCTPEGRPSFEAGPGVPMGALEAIGGVPRWYEPVTETKVVALSGDVEVLFDVLEDNFDMAMDYLSTMGRGWLRSMERIADSHPALLKQFFGCE
jgi:CRP-like cAMP-binding protein